MTLYYIIKFSERIEFKYSHQKNTQMRQIYKAMNVVSHYTAGILLRCTCISNHPEVCLNHLTTLSIIYPSKADRIHFW